MLIEVSKQVNVLCAGDSEKCETTNVHGGYNETGSLLIRHKVIGEVGSSVNYLSEARSSTNKTRYENHVLASMKGSEGILILYFLLGTAQTVCSLTLGSSVHCAVRREISPCTCRYQEPSARSTKLITVTCEEMTSFKQVVTALQDKFEKDVDINLKISYSTLDDLPQLSFQQIGITINQLRLSYDNLSALPESVFLGLSSTELFSLEGNVLSSVPQQVLRLMPQVKTLDLGKGLIRKITSSDFEFTPLLRSLALGENIISNIDMNTFPPSVVKLQLSRNRITNLNGTLRGLFYLEWLFVNNNEIETLDNELPSISPNTKLVILNAAYNRLSKPPAELENYLVLDRLYLEHNTIVGLFGALSKCRRMKFLDVSHNNLTELLKDEFSDLKILEELQLSHNNISILNRSLTSLKSLKRLNLSFNALYHFSLQELRGLTRLKLVDLSNNNIEGLSGNMEQNLVDLNTKVNELRLEFNRLESLSGALNGIVGLYKLNISHNKFEQLHPQDFIGLKDLVLLDVSHNELKTLYEAPPTLLPKLDSLIASFNYIKALNEDFYGLPQLCRADLSYNTIESISPLLADKTQCRVHNVNSTLRIYLQGNPVLCIPSQASSIILLESKNNTKVHGSTDCSLTSNITNLVQPVAAA